MTDHTDYQDAEEIAARISAAASLLREKLAADRQAKRQRRNRVLTWAVSNGIAAACLYYGFVEGVTGARNVALFWVWLGFALSLITMADAVKENLRTKGPPTPIWIDRMFDLAVVGFLAWHGSPFLAVVYLIHMLLIHSAYAVPTANKATA